MTEKEAVAKLEALRAELDIPESFSLQEAEERFIEYTADILEPGPVSSARAWCVRVGKDSAWVEVSFDVDSGEVVRVMRSRSAA